VELNGRRAVIVGFSMKIAPGVRVRASSRGVGASVGPFSAWTNTSSGRRRRTANDSLLLMTLEALERRNLERQRRIAEQQYMQQLAELEELRELENAMLRLTEQHLDDFPAGDRPVAPDPEPVDDSAVKAQHLERAMSGLSLFALKARRDAREEGFRAAEAEIAAERDRRQRERVEQQVAFDEVWERITANDPELVVGLLEACFADNAVPAAPLNVEGDAATVLVRLPSREALIPAQVVRETRTQYRITELKKTEQAAFYFRILASTVVATVRETFAIAPGVNEISLLVVRDESTTEGDPVVTPLYCGVFPRDFLLGYELRDAYFLEDVLNAFGVVRLRGRTRDLAPLVLSGEPEIRAAVEQIATDLDRTVNPLCYPRGRGR
jgi:hypothetical protein